MVPYWTISFCDTTEDDVHWVVLIGIKVIGQWMILLPNIWPGGFNLCPGVPYGIKMVLFGVDAMVQVQPW